MPESFIRLPQDGIGRRVRSRQRTIGGNEVEEQYVLALGSDRVVQSRWFAHPGVFTVGASADTGTAGRWYLWNPTASAVLVAVRGIDFFTQHGSALATPTSPRIAIKRFTATGTPSGTAVTPAAQDSQQSAAAATLRLASTGLTVTDGAVVTAFLPTAALTAASAAPPGVESWRPDVEYPLILRAGEGIYCQQLDAGTTSDTRRYLTDLIWDEFTWP